MVRASLAFGALLLSGAVLAAPESLMKVDTAKGEILLEVQANGTVTAKISKISTACDLRTSAVTRVEGEKQLAQAQADMRKAFQNNGLGSAMLDFSVPSTTDVYGLVETVAAEAAAKGAVDAAADAAGNAAVGSYESPTPRLVSLVQRVGISTATAQEMEQARAIFSENGCQEDYQFVRRPNIEIANSAAAETEAKVKAIAAAKKQAGDYATALGMRVVRILRVSESGAIKEFLGTESDFILQEMRGDRNRQKPVSNEMPVTASIAVDFVLEPK